MKSITSITLIAAAMMVASIATAKVEIGKDNQQTTKLKDSGVANAAAGAGKAILNLNSVNGKVEIKGNNKQDFEADKAVIVNGSVGAGTAEMNLGSVSGK